MTRYDLRIAGILLFGVIALGLLIGFGVGHLTAPDRSVPQVAPSQPAAFEGTASTGAKTIPGATVPGYEDVYVNDYAGLLSGGSQAAIRAALIELYDRTGIEMTVLTIDRMRDFGHPGTIESFATRLFNTWRIGNADSNDGVLVLVSRFDRRMRIELGAGWPRSRDRDAKRMIDDHFLPHFRNDNYQRGIETGVNATIQEFGGFYPGEYDMPTVQRGWSWILRQIQSFGGFAYGLMAIPLGGFFFWLRRYLRKRPRPCPSCQTLMLRAGEQADDEHLDGGQRLEEFLRAVDYDVWHCPNCAHMEIHRYPAWFSGHSACPSCSYKTLSSDSTVISAATKHSTGRKRIDYTCHQCDYENSETRTIPKISSSSSSGGSSRSSFGGGFSSGGGASGSW